jgi:hypothetical protein
MNYTVPHVSTAPDWAICMQQLPITVARLTPPKVSRSGVELKATDPRTCTKCKTPKTVADFRYEAKTNRYKSHCRVCERAHAKRMRERQQ